MAGLTDTGLTIKSVDEIQDELVAEQLTTIQADLNTEADSVLGQMNGIYAAALASLYELIEEIYQSAYADTATGQALSYIAALTGVYRREATKAELRINMFGTADTVVPAGTRFYPPDDADSLWETAAEQTLTGGAVLDVLATAVTAGSQTTHPEGVNSIIDTPVTGLDFILPTGATAEPLTLGRDEETDSQLRSRRELTLAQSGSTTVDAIQARMLTVLGVDSCKVFENTSGVTDPYGVPGHSIEVLVYSSEAPTPAVQDIVDGIWANKPAGTGTYGSLSGTATDSEGQTHTVYYSEPTTLRGYVTVTIRRDASGTYPGDAAFKQAIKDWSLGTLTVGRDLNSSDIVNVSADISGVEYVDTVATKVGTSAPGSAYQIVSSNRELITLDVSDITVVVL